MLANMYATEHYISTYQLSQKLLKRILKERDVPPGADPLQHLSEEDLRFNEQYKVLIGSYVLCYALLGRFKTITTNRFGH